MIALLRRMWRRLFKPVPHTDPELERWRYTAFPPEGWQ